MKILGIILILSGIGGIISGDIVPAIIMIIGGILLFKNKKAKKNKAKATNTIKPITQSTSASISKKPNFDNHFFFNVVGISKKNDRNEEIQKLIKNFVKEQLENMEEPYEGYTNKDILEYGEDVYEAELYGYDEITLEPEPNNSYDPDAIKIMHEEIGHIGYVPREFTSRVKTALINDCDIEWKLVGGKMKYVDYDEYKVKTKTLNYGVVIDIYYNVLAID